MTDWTLRKLPAALEPLGELALNLRWTWSHAADRLWEMLDRDIWLRNRNPWRLLQVVSERRLGELAQDQEFLRVLHEVVEQRREYLTQATWHDQRAPDKPPLVAYFCLEYGLAEALPLYAGGLGVLAGDHLKTASDLGVPMVAVGLLYQVGYLRQVLDAAGEQRELYPANTPGTLPITAVRDADGGLLSVPLAFPGRTLLLRVWRAQVGRVPLFLLDTNDPQNSPADRGITASLYPDAKETRFAQQIVLGIGGWRALAALGYRPEVCHFNEGHAAIVALERARGFMQEHQVGFWPALWATRAGNVFTTHTPVAAAFDAFAADLVFKYAREYAAQLGTSDRELLALGQSGPEHPDEPFNLAYLALRTCGKVNAVSALHGDVSRSLFAPLYPRWPVSEVPIQHITNGVHVPSWDSAWSDEVWTAACGKRRWHGELETVAAGIAAVDDATLWNMSGRERRDLVDYVRTRLARQLGQQGADPEGVRNAAHVLDPNALTLGFARRFTSYKRPNLLLHDPERLARLLRDPERPMQIVVAGKAHPQDIEGKRLVKQWAQFCRRADVSGRAVFLEDYDLDIAQELVQGVDVWINTPRRSWEACGTSGMKVLANGGLNLSELDGWWAEAYTPEVGWALTGANGTPDAVEAEALYRLLEQEVVPRFYQRDAEGIARKWVAASRLSLSTLAPRFSSNRMLREYVDGAYVPGAAAYARRCAAGAGLAVELQRWSETLRGNWHELRFGNFESQREGDHWRLRLQVYLGEITADAVAVELYADASSSAAAQVLRMQRGPAIAGGLNAYTYEAEVTAQRPPAEFTPRIVPWHAEAAVPLELHLIHWYQRPQ